MKPETFVENNREKMIEDICGLVAVPSVFEKETAGEGKPFGQEIAKALTWILERAQKMGMEVKNFDGYAGEITVGKGDRIIGILAHIDVVAPGEGWQTNPFEAEVIDGKLYGRGALDDKGPLISCLYAVAYLMEESLIPADAAVRIVIGCDEEESWRCMKYYNQKAERLPDVAIVPDGNFPLINCEKGLLDIDFSYAAGSKIWGEEHQVKVKKLCGGTAKNVVPGKACCVLACESRACAADLAAALCVFESVEAKAEDCQVSVVVQGKSAHAMSPEKGVNAVSLLMEVLEEVSARFDIEPVYEIYNRYIGMNDYGEKFGMAFEDTVSGKLTFNVGLIKLLGDRLTFGASIRYPATVNGEQVISAVRRTCEQAGMEFDITDHMDSLYVNAESDFVRILKRAYEKISGDTSASPLSIGGATYARAIPGAAAFGPLFPHEEELAHEPNEYLDLESLHKMTLIYIEALRALLKMEKTSGK